MMIVEIAIHHFHHVPDLIGISNWDENIPFLAFEFLIDLAKLYRLHKVAVLQRKHHFRLSE